MRAFARELGVDLSRVKGTGPKDRILQEDVQKFVKGVMSGATAGPAAGAGGAGLGNEALGLLPWPKVDFSKFGAIESKPLSRIKKISGANLHRNWVLIPHVTNHDDADITDLEAFRVQLNKENEKSGVKVTMLAFLIKASVAALKKFPEFNASLDGDNLIFKKYYNIGFAADTPNGLVVPVIKNADQKGLIAIAKEMTRAFGQGARRQAGARGHAGRMLFDLESRRHRRHVLHADHQRAGSVDPGRLPVEHAPGVGRQAVRSAPDPAAVAVVGSSRHRWRGGGAFQQLPDRAAR